VVGFVVAVNNFGDTRSGSLAGPMGLFIIVLMAVAVVLLIRNMNKRVRRLPDSFPDPDAEHREAEVAGLDANPGLPGPGPLRPQVDESRSRRSAGEADSEVNGVSPADSPAERGADQDRP
jgi:hypothetical protein